MSPRVTIYLLPLSPSRNPPTTTVMFLWTRSHAMSPIPAGSPPTDVGVADCCLAVSGGSRQPMTECYHTLCKDLTGCVETSSQLTQNTEKK